MKDIALGENRRHKVLIMRNLHYSAHTEVQKSCEQEVYTGGG
jgi:hypothetical protein